MRREDRVTVQGPVKEQQPDGMSHRGGSHQFWGLQDGAVHKSNAQGDHEVRAPQQPPNAAEAKRAIHNQDPPLPPRGAPQGRGLRPVRREVPATGVATGP